MSAGSRCGTQNAKKRILSELIKKGAILVTDPKDILKELDKTGGKYIVIPDRKEAIKYSIEHAKEGDVILLIGKGHEDYKEINGKRTHFDEREVIQEILEELKK